jgi:hypothetical protein
MRSGLDIFMKGIKVMKFDAKRARKLTMSG